MDRMLYRETETLIVPDTEDAIATAEADGWQRDPPLHVWYPHVAPADVPAADTEAKPKKAKK